MNNLGQYVPRKSPVHRRDPRVKIIAVIILSIIVLRINISGLLLITGLTVIISQLAHIPLGILMRTLKPAMPVFFFLFIMYILFTPGYPLPGFGIGPLQITYQGLNLGLLQVWRFLLLVAAASILTMTTQPSELTIAVERLLRPIIGSSSHDIAMMVSLALRFIPTLLDEMNNINEARKARGDDFNPYRIRKRIRGIKSLAAPLLINVLRRCDDLVDAMEARGYQRGSRTYLYEMELILPDYCIIVVSFAALIIILVWF